MVRHGGQIPGTVGSMRWTFSDWATAARWCTRYAVSGLCGPINGRLPRKQREGGERNPGLISNFHDRFPPACGGKKKKTPPPPPFPPLLKNEAIARLFSLLLFLYPSVLRRRGPVRNGVELLEEASLGRTNREPLEVSSCSQISHFSKYSSRNLGSVLFRRAFSSFSLQRSRDRFVFCFLVSSFFFSCNLYRSASKILSCC